MGQKTWRFSRARKIRDSERDQALRLDQPDWPADVCPDGWQQGSDHLYRYISSCSDEMQTGSASVEGGQLAVPLKESLLRFPSAPVKGIQRFHVYHGTPPLAENLHTYRVLTSCTPPAKIGRIFLFHNGLNELDRMGLYYQLASQIIASHSSDGEADDEEGVACVLRPFPGHLTRAPFANFAEEPLHRYLWDGSYLFSQFLRYMIETQWFLSAMVKRSRYRCPSGAELLLEGETPANSRLDSELLSTEVQRRWHDLYQASTSAVDAAADSGSEIQRLKDPPKGSVFSHAIHSLRRVLRLEEWDDLGGTLGQDGHKEEPSLHVAGYSLGGFTAQSVFMSWPFVVSSCATLLSGGALRELSPTAFAHPEEWQTVLHSLRYEVDEGMLNNRFQTSAKMVAGLDRELFHYLQRTFYEVFQQEYHGSYESRVEAFRQRMLFVVGGNDPIVRPDSVLDSAPAGGMNLLEIGGLGHFLGRDPKGDEETQQRRFWLPEVGGLIGRFSTEAAARHSVERVDTWLDEELKVTKGKGDDAQVRPMSDRESVELPGDGALASRQFGICLNDLLARQISEDRRGHLFVLRNEIPTLLLPSRAVQRRARAIFHDDHQIVRYSREVGFRASAFSEMRQTTLVLPWNIYDLTKYLDPNHRFPSQAETAVGQIADEISFRETWDAFEENLEGLHGAAPGALRIFDGRDTLTTHDGGGERAAQLIESMQTHPLHVPSLPDCWLWVAPGFLGYKPGVIPTVKEEREALIAKCGEGTSALAEELRKDNARLITISRARYNPRFRGKLVLNVRAFQQTLVHIALCLAASDEYSEFDLERRELSVD